MYMNKCTSVENYELRKSMKESESGGARYYIIIGCTSVPDSGQTLHRGILKTPADTALEDK